MKKNYTQSAQEVLNGLGVGAEGLSTAEALRRREQYGPNKLKEAEKATWFQRFMEQLKDPMLIILMIAAVVSAATTVLDFLQLPEPHDFGHLTEGLVEVGIILVVVLLNAILGVIQESKAEAAIEALQTMTAATCKVIRDGKQILATPGDGALQSAVYCVYGRECAKMVKVESRWESYTLTGYVSKPTDSRPSRSLQTFFVNDRPVQSKLLIRALEEAYRNQIMVGKFPACVLHLKVPANAVDVNVHPAKTEVKFLSEKAVFDCVHYGVLAALNQQTDRPQVQFKPAPEPVPAPQPVAAPKSAPQTPPKQQSFFRINSLYHAGEMISLVESTFAGVICWIAHHMTGITPSAL